MNAMPMTKRVTKEDLDEDIRPLVEIAHRLLRSRLILPNR